MANTEAQRKVEAWIREEWLELRFGCEFKKKKVRLEPGGEFEFDAVSDDGRIVANISTSGSKTARGKPGIGKVNKVRSDIYFLLLSTADRTLMLLTEPDMYELWLREKDKGRVPVRVEFRHVRIPGDLNQRLKDARGEASREVQP